MIYVLFLVINIALSANAFRTNRTAIPVAKLYQRSFSFPLKIYGLNTKPSSVRSARVYLEAEDGKGMAGGGRGEGVGARE